MKDEKIEEETTPESKFYLSLSEKEKYKRYSNKTIIILSSILILLCNRAYAGTPYLTDDPGMPLHGWEIKTVGIYEHDLTQDSITSPVLDINYNFIPEFKLNLTLAGRTVLETGKRNFGLLDTDFKGKWRFLDENEKTWNPAISVAPDVTIPTGDKVQGLSDGLWRFRIPFQFGKTFGKFYTYAEVGPQFVFGNSSQLLLYGYALQYQVNDNFNIGAEINGNIPFDKPINYLLIGNLGTNYAFNEHWQIQVSIGRSFRSDISGGPLLLVQTFIQANY